MGFNYSKLRGRIIEMYGSQRTFAEKMKMSNETLSRKLTGKTYFRQDEICKISELLGIKTEQFDSYFFCRQN